jgi:hypothetical protein
MNDNLLDDQFEEKEHFDQTALNQILKVRNEADELLGKIRSARTMLFILAGLSGLNIVLLFRQESDTQTILIFTCLLVATFLVLGLLTAKSPKITLSMALGIYLLLTILGIVGGESIGAGIFMRIFVIYFLGQGVTAAFKLPSSLQQLQRLGVPKHWLEKAKKLQSLPTTRELR